MADHNLGTAWLQVSLSGQGISKQIRRELGDVDTGPLSNKIKSTVGNAFRTVGAIGGAALAVAGAALASYSGEVLKASDSAQKFSSTLEFAGIGTEKIKELTASTKAYAAQTVYDIGDIRQTTAALAANGVADYDKLAQAAGNLNAVAGGSAETYKTVGSVMAQTAGAGKLVTENWNQIRDAVPGASKRIKDALAESGAYVGDFNDAMMKGEITAEEFNDAIMKLGFEEAAVKAAASTATFEGAWGNFEATIVDGLSEIIEPIKGDLTGALGVASEALGGFFSSAADMVKNARDLFADGDSLGLKQLGNSIGPIAGTLAGMLGPLLSGLPFIGGLFTGLTGPVGLVIGLFGQMFANSSQLRAAFTDLAVHVMDAFAAFGPAIDAVLPVIGSLAGGLGDQIAPIIQMLGPLIEQVASTLGTALVPIIGAVGQVIQALFPVLSAVISTVVEIVQAVLPSLLPVVTMAGETFGMLVAAISPVVEIIGEILTPIIEALAPVVTTVFEGAAAVITAAMQYIQGIIKTVTAIMSGDWSGAWEGMKQAAAALWGLIGSAIEAAINIVKSVISSTLQAIQGIWDAIWNRIGDGVTAAWEGIKSSISNGIDSAYNTVVGIKDRIVGFFSGAGQWLYDAGSSIINGLIDGLYAGFEWVKSTLNELTSLLPDWKGPAEVDRVILRESGRLVMGGFREGLEDEYGSIEKTLGSFTRGLTSAPYSGHGPQKYDYGPAGNQMPTELVVVDAGGEIIARMQVEARKEVAKATKPASRSRAREVLGID